MRDLRNTALIGCAVPFICSAAYAEAGKADASVIFRPQDQRTTINRDLLTEDRASLPRKLHADSPIVRELKQAQSAIRGPAFVGYVVPGGKGL